MSYFSQSQEEAEKRFKKYRSLDPFPDIKPALLNRADIMNYVAATGMIYPFNPDDLKPASYVLRLGSPCIFFDENGDKKQIKIQRGEQFISKSNSISFASVKGFFQFPDYIAGRFNLRIKNVYRGLLLGTGPLVDPGFVGKLSFPLHNLTLNDYVFMYDENMIWMEFTKLSENQKWITELPEKNQFERKGFYEPNIKFKKRVLWNVNDYIFRAEPHRPVRSSIPEEMKKNQEVIKHAQDILDKAKLDAETAKKDAEQARIESENAKRIAERVEKRERTISIAVALIVLISLTAITVTVVQLYCDMKKYVVETEKRINQDVSKNNQMYLESLKKIDNLDSRTANLENNQTVNKKSSKADVNK